MTAKPLRVLPLAEADIATAIDYYRDQAGEEMAVRFVDAVTARLGAIARSPGLGSSRYATELRIDGLRCRRLARFPYLLFYLEQPDRIDVWRMLHDRRDIPGTLRDR